MEKKFAYNPKTGKLHIRGYCCQTKGTPYGFIFFETEREALAYDGRAVGMCKICQKKREKEANIN